MQIFDWPFCGHHGVTCKDCVTYEIGKYLDMTIAVKGKHAAVTKNNGVSDGETFDVGSGYIVFSRKVNFKDFIHLLWYYGVHHRKNKNEA